MPDSESGNSRILSDTMSYLRNWVSMNSSERNESYGSKTTSEVEVSS